MNTTIQITTPLPLYTRDSFTSSFDKPETDLHAFGYTFTPSTESRHDRRLSLSTSTSSLAPPETLPPTYFESHRDVVPEYTATYEPITLAMYLFRFGFLFPPFWLMGAFILFTPLRAPPPPPTSAQDEETTVGSWLPEKSDAEKEAFVAHMRKAEIKWAKRCLVAFVVFAAVVGVVAGVAVWATSK